MIKLIERYLNDNKNYPNSNELYEYYQSHPNFPSLFSAKEALTYFDIESYALKVGVEDYENLPKTFITTHKGELIYIVKKNKLNVSFLTENFDKKDISRKELMDNWTGIVFLVDYNESIMNNKKNNKVLGYLLLPVLCLLSLLNHEVNYFKIIIFIISFLGIITSIQIVKIFLNKNLNDQKFCSFNESLSCTDIINSKSKILGKYIDFVDLSVVYFVFLYVVCLLDYNFSTIFKLIGFAGIPFILYSIYLQKFVLKKWCVLCLCVAFLFLLSISTFILMDNNFAINQEDLFKMIIIFIIILVLWYWFKEILSKNNEYSNKITSLLRFKRDAKIFYNSALEVKNIEKLKKLDKIILGNEFVKNKLILFITPSCNHCHDAIKESLKLIDSYPNEINLEICYNLNIENKNNVFLKIAKMILWYNNNSISNNKVLEMITDFHVRKINHDLWIDKWYMEKDFSNEEIQLKNQYDFCKENGYNFSPVRVFNDIFVTSHYQIDELNFFFI